MENKDTALKTLVDMYFSGLHSGSEAGNVMENKDSALEMYFDGMRSGSEAGNVMENKDSALEMYFEGHFRSLEKLDILSAVETPDTSDVEGEEIDEPLFRGHKQIYLSVEAVPSRKTSYSNLYEFPKYRAKAELKVRRMKAEVKKRGLSETRNIREFNRIVFGLEKLYPDDGGRRMIAFLVACHKIFNPNSISLSTLLDKMSLS
jgi:hypothetical protein